MRTLFAPSDILNGFFASASCFALLISSLNDIVLVLFVVYPSRYLPQVEECSLLKFTHRAYGDFDLATIFWYSDNDSLLRALLALIQVFIEKKRVCGGLEPVFIEYRARSFEVYHREHAVNPRYRVYRTGKLVLYGAKHLLRKKPLYFVLTAPLHKLVRHRLRLLIFKL